MAADLVVLDPNTVNGWEIVPNWDNDITRTRSGGEEVVIRRGIPILEFTPPFEWMDRTQGQALLDFYNLRCGSGRPFLLWNPAGLYVASSRIGTGNGSQTVFQLSRTISDSANSVTFNILHPVPTGTAIPPQYQGYATGTTTTSIGCTVGGVAKTEGADFTVSPSTGLVTFTSAPANTAAVVMGPFWYYIAVRFDGPLPMDLDSLYYKTAPKLVQVLFA